MAIDARIPLMGRHLDLQAAQEGANRVRLQDLAVQEHQRNMAVRQAGGTPEEEAAYIQRQRDRQEQMQLSAWERDTVQWDLQTARYLAASGQDDQLQSFLNTRLNAAQENGWRTTPLYQGGLNAFQQGGSQAVLAAIDQMGGGQGQEAFTLSPGSVRYDANGNVIADNPKVETPKDPTTRDRKFVDEDGNTYTQAFDSSTGEPVGQPTLTAKAPEPGQDDGMTAAQRAQEKSRTDKAEQAKMLAEDMIGMLSEAANQPGVGTGMIEGSFVNPRNYFGAGREFRENFESKRAQLALLAKAMLRAPGEGPFTEGDQRVLDAALADLGRDESANITALQTILQLANKSVGGDQSAAPPQPKRPEEMTDEELLQSLNNG